MFGPRGVEIEPGTHQAPPGDHVFLRKSIFAPDALILKLQKQQPGYGMPTLISEKLCTLDCRLDIALLPFQPVAVARNGKLRPRRKRLKHLESRQRTLRFFVSAVAIQQKVRVVREVLQTFFES
jgi:hypothetical protein